MVWRKEHGAKLTHTHAFADEAAPSSGAVWKLHHQVSPGCLRHTAPELSAPAHTSNLWPAASWQAPSLPHQGSSCACQRHVHRSRRRPTPSLLGAPAREYAAMLRMQANSVAVVSVRITWTRAHCLWKSCLTLQNSYPEETKQTAQAQQHMP